MKNLMNTIIIFVTVLTLSGCSSFDIVSKECDWYIPVNNKIESFGNLNREAQETLIHNDEMYIRKCK